MRPSGSAPEPGLGEPLTSSACPPMLELHRVSQPCLDRMAAGHTEPDFTAWLREANRSKQLALLRTVLEKAPTLAPLSEAQDAWNLLATANTQNPAMVDPVLTDPQTGLWTTGILRRLRNPDAGSTVPLWAEFGRLHLMAASAAVRARLDFTLKIPAWHGTIMLPALGLVSLPGEQQWGHVEIQAVEGRALVQGASGQVILPDDLAADGPGWQA